MQRKTELKSELNALAGEYKRLYGLPNIIQNESILHTSEFKDWISNVVMDTINYEKLLLQIIKMDGYNFPAQGYIAEINSKPILSVSETITNDMLQSYNYSGYINELGSDRRYQRLLSELKWDLNTLCTNLLIMQSYQTEFDPLQLWKLEKISKVSEMFNIPFILGCYGDNNQDCYNKKVQILNNFIEEQPIEFNCYNESYNDVNCRIYIPRESKILVRELTR